MKIRDLPDWLAIPLIIGIAMMILLNSPIKKNKGKSVLTKIKLWFKRK